jgi:hypothetical protein
VRPFAADDLPAVDLQATGITTVEPQRTYWDKVVILHGLRAWMVEKQKAPNRRNRPITGRGVADAASSRR